MADVQLNYSQINMYLESISTKKVFHSMEYMFTNFYFSLHLAFLMKINKL
jgi:hypothetical protein